MIFSILNNPDYGTIIGNTPSLLYTPLINFSANDTISFTVYDGSLIDTGYVFLKIHNPNIAPVAYAGEDLFTLQGMDIILDGSGSYDVNGDSLSFFWSSSDVINIVDSLSKNTSASIPYLTIETDTTLFITLKVYDGEIYSDPDTLKINISALTDNDLITELPLDSISIGTSIDIGITMPNNFVVDTINLRYSLGLDFETIAMETGSYERSGTVYNATIPSDKITTNGVAYYIYALDVKSNIFTTDTLNIPVKFDKGIISSSIQNSPLNEGIKKDKWYLISFPGIPDNSSTDLLETIFNQSSGEDSWRLYKVDGPNFYEPSFFQPGEGYWIKQLVEDNAFISIGSGETADLTGQSLFLDPGWNVISSPYLFPVTLNYDPLFFSQIYAYGDDNGEGWLDTNTTKLHPWAGYAIFNRTEKVQELILDPLGSGSNNYQTNNYNDGNGWALKFSTSNGMYSDNSNYIGRRSDALNMQDNNDLPEQPDLKNDLRLFSSQVLRSLDTLHLSKDFRKLDHSSQVWNLFLKQPDNQESIHLTFENYGNNNQELWLLDLFSKKKTKLLFQDNKKISINIPNYNGYISKLKIISAMPDSIQKEIDDILASLPLKFSLGNNYPNPFNPSTIIPFELIKPSFVSINVYDLLGRKVRELVNNYENMGKHSILWDGSNDLGLKVSSGVYIVKMKADKFFAIKKVILIR